MSTILFRSTVLHPVQTTIAGVTYKCDAAGTVEIPAKFARLVIDRGLPLSLAEGQALPSPEPVIGPRAQAIIAKIRAAQSPEALDRLGDEVEKGRMQGGWTDDERRAIDKAGQARFDEMKAAFDGDGDFDDGDGNVPEGDTDDEDGTPVDLAEVAQVLAAPPVEPAKRRGRKG